MPKKKKIEIEEDNIEPIEDSESEKTEIMEEPQEPEENLNPLNENINVIFKSKSRAFFKSVLKDSAEYNRLLKNKDLTIFKEV